MQPSLKITLTAPFFTIYFPFASAYLVTVVSLVWKSQLGMVSGVTGAGPSVLFQMQSEFESML